MELVNKNNWVFFFESCWSLCVLFSLSSLFLLLFHVVLFILPLNTIKSSLFFLPYNPKSNHFLLCIKPKIPKKTHKPFFNNSKLWIRNPPNIKPTTSTCRKIPKSSYITMRERSPHYGSDQKWMWEPSPIINLMCLEKGFHPLQIYSSISPTPCDPLNHLCCQILPMSSAYFESYSFSTPNLCNHFPRRAWLQVSCSV